MRCRSFSARVIADVKQAALFLGFLRRTGPEIGRHAAVNDVEDIDGLAPREDLAHQLLHVRYGHEQTLIA
jgi:hypothetical protein